jgi:hypothetical protein
MGTIHCAPTILYSLVGALFIMPVIFQDRPSCFSTAPGENRKYVYADQFPPLEKGG